MTQPRLRYHPDPVATGSAVPTVEACVLCGVARGWRYAGPIYGRQIDVPCLHCIASGQASRMLTSVADWPCMFTDAVDVPADVPIAVVEEVTQRTLGFCSWQQAGWLYHCGDGAAFLGVAGYEELRSVLNAFVSEAPVAERGDLWATMSSLKTTSRAQPEPTLTVLFAALFEGVEGPTRISILDLLFHIVQAANYRDDDLGARCMAKASAGSSLPVREALAGDANVKEACLEVLDISGLEQARLVREAK